MRDYYADSSVLTKCYVDERGTEFMLRLVADSSNWVFCSAVGEVEVVSALARRGYGDRLPSSVVETKVSEARADFDRKYHVVTITADLLSMACAVAQRRRLRGYDAVHLATALSISRAGRRHTGLGLTMLPSDGALNDAARAEGLDVIDPSAEA